MKKNTKGLKCGGKMYVILVYDIKADEQGKRILPKVYKTCKKYLIHIQNSVFEGDISESNLTKLNKELSRLIRKESDSLIVFKSRDSKWLSKSFWGMEDDKCSNFL